MLIAWIKTYRRICSTYHKEMAVITWLLIRPSIMLTKYIANPTKILENIDWKPLAFAYPLLICTTVCRERVCRLQQYSQVVAAYNNLQTIFSLTVSIIGLPRAHSDDVAYQDVKESWFIIAKMQCRRSC